MRLVAKQYFAYNSLLRKRVEVHGVAPLSESLKRNTFFKQDVIKRIARKNVVAGITFEMIKLEYSRDTEIGV